LNRSMIPEELLLPTLTHPGLLYHINIICSIYIHFRRLTPQRRCLTQLDFLDNWSRLYPLPRYLVLMSATS